MEQPTCGEGLAEHSRLHRRLGDLTAALAENVEVHMQSLDLTDDNARAEHDAYAKLAAEHREVAAALRETGEQMAGYRDLPMGRHDEEAMASPEAVAAFERFAAVERELLALLKEQMEQHQKMLAGSS